MFFNREIELNNAEKLIFLRAVLEVVVADNIIDKTEADIIKKIGAAYKMTPEMLETAKAALNRKLTEDELKKLSSRQKKLELLKVLCLVATVDNDLQEKESRLIIHLADMLGISRQQLLEIYDLVQDIFLIQTKSDLVMEQTPETSAEPDN